MANADSSDPCPSRSCRSAILDESSSDDDDELELRALARGRRPNLNIINDSSSDSGSSIDLIPRRRASRPPVLTDSDSSSSGSDIVLRKKSRPLAESGSESGWSSPQQGTSSNAVVRKESSSSDSDGQSEKCPICLLTFKLQEVASPEVCDHSFCVECIQEWSKNVNTCPVDRQPFNLILVRSHYGGKVTRQIPIESARPQFENPAPQEDPTFCEMCGRCDREDRMLLCDGCDLGFHLDCLNPPLRDVPSGLWYCSDCGPDEAHQDVTIYLHEVELLLNDADDLDRPTGPRRRNTHRIIPRTRQSERVRARILTNRTQNRNQDEVEESIEVVVSQGPSTSRPVGRSRKKRRKYKRKKPKIKITYEINEETGQKIVIESKTRTYRRKKKKSRRSRALARRVAQPKTVKKRLAVQLGMCAPRQAGQTLPDVKITGESSGLGFQRSQAGIPALHLFGPRNDLDYFSASDADNEGDGLHVLTRRRPNMSDVAIFRRQAQRKSMLLPPPAVASSSDLLGSILDSQEKFHSKNAVLSLNNDGTLKVDKKAQFNNNDNRVNLNNSRNVRVRTAPTYSTNETTSSTTTTGHDNSSSSNNASSTTASSEMDVVTTTNNSVGASGQENGDTEAACSYSLHPTCADAEEKRKNEDSSQHSESELDIYSDIETVSTSKAEESDFKVPSPPPTTTDHMQSDEDANNSDIDLVIDTEKVDDKTKEEAVSSTTNVLLSDKEDDEDSEDGCPNFSIYSKESINLAQSTDLELLHQEANQANEVGSSLDEPKMARKSKMNDLYSDSDDDVVKIDSDKPFGIGDIRSMTEDISEEERSYTPCLDERAPVREGLEGLETEAISDEERNDFDESHEHKTVSDGDALEINAKDCELDFAKPEEYEEGEIVDKLKKLEEAKQVETAVVEETEVPVVETPTKEKEKDKEKVVSKESEVTKETFKKISKSNKDRNYRDKEKARTRSHSKEKNKENERDKRRDKKKEKRKEIERYNVRTVVAEKPRRMKDKFGRDERRRRSLSRSSRSTSPQYRSSSRGRRSYSREPKRRARSHTRSRSRKRSRSRNKRRSLSRTRVKRRKTRERSVPKKKNRSRSRSRTPKRRRDWERRWSRSPSRSRTVDRHISPSWTPPRVLEKQPMKSHNLTVTVPNDSNKKKKDKKKAERRKKDSAIERRKRKRDKTPPPSKEVFASGDNILVSVSFNKENDEREATIKRKRDDEVTTKRTRKEKEKRVRGSSPKAARKKRHDLSGVKPVAIIDLDRSPFKELTPSPKDVIVLSDSENGDPHKSIPCDSSQQADAYATGPKTPPEPQVKFALNAKPAQMRPITNPLHEADDIDQEIDPQEELEQRLNETLHKGPNTPPDPPNSPPSSPDAYDPFDPTKSRSPTPENDTTVQSSNAQLADGTIDLECSTQNLNPSPAKTPEAKSHTPPTTDIQPADSQSNASANTPEPNKPTSDVVIIPQVTQNATSLVTSTPAVTVQSRINIINNTILPLIVPNIPKQPAKAAPKQQKTPSKAARKAQNRSNDSNDSNMEFDSPYSPGPSDYEDLFEPPVETTSKQNNKSSKKAAGGKTMNTFDTLFGSSPIHRNTKSTNKTPEKKKSGKVKLVGVKIDEDSLRILDDVPNSAVEMQVKDKFLKKLNRQERVVEEVKLVLKPHYNKKNINKEEYKDILRRAVPKICHNKSGEINPKKIQNLIEAYVKKLRHSKKVTSSSSVNNPQK